MSDEYFKENRTTSLYFWSFGHMARGAAYAAAFVIAIGLFLWALYGVGLLLPDESKQAPAPMGALELPLETRDVA